MIPSKMSVKRDNEEFQSPKRREQILEVSRDLFLERGLDKTSMKDIAQASQINRATLYRYFPDLERIAVEVSIGILREDFFPVRIAGDSKKRFASAIMAMIDNFHTLKKQFSFFAVYDSLYTDSSRLPGGETSAWYGQQLLSLLGLEPGEESGDVPPLNAARLIMIGNAVMSFLKTLAIRGRILEEEQGVGVDAELTLFRQMIARELAES